MKNIQPDMDLARQVQKGCARVHLALDEGNLQKAMYATSLVIKMLNGVVEGQPQPWSTFAPMIDEEYDHN